MTGDLLEKASLAAFTGLVAGDGTHEDDVGASLALGRKWTRRFDSMMADDWKPTAKGREK